VKEVITVKVLAGILAVVLALPVLLVVAIALGPVVLGILCAVGFGLIVFAVVNILIGIGALGSRAVEQAGSWHSRHAAHRG
jgi:polyferredoxin